MSVPQEIRSQLEGKQWYHQGFDGSPLFLNAVAPPQLIGDDRIPTGIKSELSVCFYKNGRADWYYDIAEIDHGASVIVDAAKKNPHLSTELLQAWKSDEHRFEKFCLIATGHFDLPTLSDKELKALWKKYNDLCAKRMSSSAVIDYFALGTDRLIANMVRQEVGSVSSESEFAEIFSRLTAPIYQSFINQAEIDLLKIAVGDSSETLEQYQARYFWTRNNYVTAQELTVEHFKREIQVWKESANDLRAQYTRLEEMPELNRRKKQELTKRHNLSSHLQALLKVSEDFTWWQDERKKATFLNIHVGSFLLEEVARRTGISRELLKYAVPAEVEALIDGAGPSTEELAGRRAGSVVIYMQGQTVVMRGQELTEEIRDILLPDPADDRPNDIRGLTASTGKVRGQAKVLASADEISKVEEGDVLIAVMTRPDYVPAMRRASAIVTDEGGITCHAAVISRELGIPCIIGTKVATSVFSDGDTLEVNANHGWVRKVSTTV